MIYPNTISLLMASILLISCNRKECSSNFDFSKKEIESIPYRADSILVFKNEHGDLDTFFITERSKRIVDKGFEIETSSHDWLEIEIRYTNKHFDENPESDRQLAWITKDCRSEDFGISASWMDFWDGLDFGYGTHFKNYSYPDTIKKFQFNSQTLLNVLKFQTDTTIWPDAVDRNVKTVYWLNGEGVIMYETRYTGTWKKIR